MLFGYQVSPYEKCLLKCFSCVLIELYIFLLSGRIHYYFGYKSLVRSCCGRQLLTLFQKTPLSCILVPEWLFPSLDCSGTCDLALISRGQHDASLWSTGFGWQHQNFPVSPIMHIKNLGMTEASKSTTVEKPRFLKYHMKAKLSVNHLALMEVLVCSW